MAHDLVVLYEHPEWQKPLFAALENRGIPFGKYDLKRAAFNQSALPASPACECAAGYDCRRDRSRHSPRPAGRTYSLPPPAGAGIPTATACN